MLPKPLVPNVWPIQISSNLITLEAFEVEDYGFKVARFGE